MQGDHIMTYPFFPRRDGQRVDEDFFLGMQCDISFFWQPSRCCLVPIYSFSSLRLRPFPACCGRKHDIQRQREEKSLGLWRSGAHPKPWFWRIETACHGYWRGVTFSRTQTMHSWKEMFQNFRACASSLIYPQKRCFHDPCSNQKQNPEKIIWYQPPLRQNPPRLRSGKAYFQGGMLVLGRVLVTSSFLSFTSYILWTSSKCGNTYVTGVIKMTPTQSLY